MHSLADKFCHHKTHACMEHGVENHHRHNQRIELFHLVVAASEALQLDQAYAAERIVAAGAWSQLRAGGARMLAHAHAEHAAPPHYFDAWIIRRVKSSKLVAYTCNGCSHYILDRLRRVAPESVQSNMKLLKCAAFEHKLCKLCNVAVQAGRRTDMHRTMHCSEPQATKLTTLKQASQHATSAVRTPVAVCIGLMSREVPDRSCAERNLAAGRC